MDRVEMIVGGTLVAAVIALIFLGALVINGSKELYQEYYNECMSESVLSQFECKQAAHHMAYGN